MIVILEGPDNSGKTMLARHLQDMIGPYALYLKSPAGVHQEWKDEWNHWVGDVCHSIQPPFTAILDRVPEISEPIYGLMFRGQNRAKNAVNEWVSWNEFRLLLVICEPPEGTVYDDEETVTGDPVGASEIPALSQAYGFVGNLLHGIGLYVMTYRWNKDGDAAKIEEAIKALIHSERPHLG